MQFIKERESEKLLMNYFVSTNLLFPQGTWTVSGLVLIFESIFEMSYGLKIKGFGRFAKGPFLNILCLIFQGYHYIFVMIIFMDS